MLNKISRHKKTNTLWFHSHEVSRVIKSIDTENRLKVTSYGQRYISVVEHLPSICEAVGFTASTMERKKKGK
jgi:hypothetical protein